MAQEGEPNQSMAEETTSPKPSPESMHLEGEFHLAMTRESIHALGVRIPNLDRRLSLYPVVKLLSRPFTHVDFVAKRHNFWRCQRRVFTPKKSIPIFRPTTPVFLSQGPTT